MFGWTHLSENKRSDYFRHAEKAKRIGILSDEEFEELNKSPEKSAEILKSEFGYEYKP